MKTNLLKKYIGYTTFKITSFDLMYTFKSNQPYPKIDNIMISDEPPKNEITYEENDSIRMERFNKKISIFLEIENARKRIEWFQKVSSKINIGDTRFDVIDYNTSNTSMRIYANPPKTKSGLIDQQESFDFLKSDIEKEKDARLYPKQSQKGKQAKDPKKKGYWDNENQMGLFDNLEQSNEYEESNNDDYVDLDDEHTSPSIVNLKKFFAISNGSVIYRELEPQIEPIDSVYANAIKTIQAIPLERQFVDFKYSIFDNAFNIFNHFFVLKNMRIFLNKKGKSSKNKDAWFIKEGAAKGFEFETHTLKSLKDSLKNNAILEERANAISKRIKLIQKTFGNRKDTQRMLNTWNGIEMVKCPKGKFVSNPFGHKKMGHKPIIEEIKNDFWLSSTSLSVANVLGILSDSQDILSKYILQGVKKHIYGKLFMFHKKLIRAHSRGISKHYDEMNRYGNEYGWSGMSFGDYVNMNKFMLLQSQPFNIEIYDSIEDEYEKKNVLEIINTNAPFVLPLKKLDRLYYGFDFEKNDYLREKKHIFCKYSIDTQESFITNTQNQNVFLMAVICNKLSEKEGLEKYYNIDYTMDYTEDFKKYKDAYMNRFNDNEKIYFSSIVVNSISVNPNAKGYRLPTKLEWDYASTMGGSVYYNGTNDDLELKIYSHSRINDLSYNILNPTESKSKLEYTYTKPQDMVEFLGKFESVDDLEKYKVCDIQALESIRSIKATKTYLPNDWGFYYMDGVYAEMCFDFDQATNKSKKINIDTMQGYSSFLYKMQHQSEKPEKKNYLNEDMLEKKYYLSKTHREDMNKNMEKKIIYQTISERLEAIEDWSVYGKTPSHTNEKSFLVMNLDFNIFDYEAIRLKYESLKVSANPSREDDVLLVYHVIDEVVLKLYEKIMSVLNYVKNKGKNISIVCSEKWASTIILARTIYDEQYKSTIHYDQQYKPTIRRLMKKDEWLGNSILFSILIGKKDQSVNMRNPSIVEQIRDNVFFDSEYNTSDMLYPLGTTLSKKFLEIYYKYMIDTNESTSYGSGNTFHHGVSKLIHNFYVNYEKNPPTMLDNLWDAIVELNEKIELIVGSNREVRYGEQMSEGLVLRLARNA